MGSGFPCWCVCRELRMFWEAQGWSDVSGTDLGGLSCGGDLFCPILHTVLSPAALSLFGSGEEQDKLQNTGVGQRGTLDTSGGWFKFLE